MGAFRIARGRTAGVGFGGHQACPVNQGHLTLTFGER